MIAAAYQSNWSSVVGALAGVLGALGSALPAAEISARSGHAFRLAITSSAGGEIGADGPNHFSARAALQLYENLGWRFERIEAAAGTDGFDRCRQEALKQMRKCIDRGRPALVFGLHLPEWGIVRGYSRDDLIASTTVSTQYGERIPIAQWPAPGRPLPVRVLLPVQRLKPRPQAMPELLMFALHYALHGEQDDLSGAPAACGFAAYERWATVLESDAAISPHGQAYCIQALQSARHDAAAFLRAAAETERMPQLERVAEAYAAVVFELSRMATLFPYPNGGDVLSAGSRRAGAACVRRAAASERTAIDALTPLVDAAAQ